MKNNLTKELITRSNSLTFHNYIGMLPNPDVILQRTGSTIETYRRLKLDPHVWSCIQSRKSGLLSMEAGIEQGAAPVHIYNAAKEAFAGLDFYNIIKDILEAPLFGWQPMEIVWKQNSRGGKHLAPTKIVARPHEWFYFDSDESLRFRSKNNPGGEQVPEYKVIPVQYEADYLNPYGSSLLSRCYWPVTFKNGGLRFWVNFMEKYGSPIVLAKYTRGATSDEVKSLAEELNGMSEEAVIVTHSGIEIDLKEANRTSSVALYKELIRHCNAEISKALLSQTLTTELDSGSYAASQTHFKIREEVILADMKLVEQTMNKIIKYFTEINFGENLSPVFVMKSQKSSADGQKKN